ncbi:PIN domain-like protein [Thelephora ganbajun]|uniref:PIN domain-like protein n=1 Tax=Thelephora ganbajun TaxID=370292 RepID=A0ACB6ZFN4_THEGA|nr:PIN domain-like protein [Thelephora ganbajun]
MGVKSLWKLLTPVGRPVLLETLEGKVLAIDSSIWIYQFQATMRDNDGRVILNAHVLGFLRRICKLLFWGIKPVFVFDGGAPVLKRSTLNERRRKKDGAAITHAKVAERILAAQMRREAVDHAQGRKPLSKGKSVASANRVEDVDEDAVYLEDLDLPIPVGKLRSKAKSQSPTKPRFYDHDPYHLPDMDFHSTIAEASRSALDPRLATAEEMHSFISEMAPSDFDLTSEAFRSLPTEIQYEIIGDLRLKSRQTSFKRLQNILKNSVTPMDFSKEQIKGLKERNRLTQQLLTTTDSIGKAHVEIPIRIAGERNREYILVKNEEEGKGWILGMRDVGTRGQPIIVDDPSREGVKPKEARDKEGKETPTKAYPSTGTIPQDQDLRRYQSRMALAAAAKRQTPLSRSSPVKSKSSVFPRRQSGTKSGVKTARVPLFVPDEEDDTIPQVIDESEGDDWEDSGELEEDVQITSDTRLPAQTPVKPSRQTNVENNDKTAVDDEDEFTSPSRLATQLSIAGARKPLSTRNPSDSGRAATVFAKRTPFVSPEKSTQCLYADDEVEVIGVREREKEAIEVRSSLPPQSDEDEDMEEIEVATASSSVPSRVLQSSVQSEVAPSFQLPLTPAPAIVETLPPQHTEEGAGVEDEEDVPISDWSRSPSPRPRPPAGEAGLPTFVPTLDRSRGLLDPEASFDQGPSGEQDQEQEHEDFDAAHEMDPDAEAGEFARWISQVKGRNLDDVRKEIEQEINGLRKEQKAAMRDSEDITGQMIAQIMMMLRLFGIPYITAPMEAEAQCAELVRLGLVEGIITDDSDVFLFGGNRVFRNMFNQSKTVECFLSSDLTRELGLDRGTLVRLAYLLGSDYTEGLAGVGPVVAMELVKEFPGEDGLERFAEWWKKVQDGRDWKGEGVSKFRKSFKKKFKALYIGEDWPDPVVRNAYYYPTVDSSEEPFKWGLPDLDGLRGMLQEELGWSLQKSDELLLPVIQRINKRGAAAAANKQSNLDAYFGDSIGSVGGSAVPRKRQAYTSKRLQKVVTDYREEQRKRSRDLNVDGSRERDPRSGSVTGTGKTSKPATAAPTKRKGAGEKCKTRKSSKVTSTASRSTKRKKRANDSDDYDDEGEYADADEVAPLPARPRPKPVRKKANTNTDAGSKTSDQERDG